MTKDEALKLALHVIQHQGDVGVDDWIETEKAIKAALAQEQEPVAWAYVNSDDECEQIEYCTESPLPEFVPLYTAPPQREWVGLTDDEIKAIVGPWGSTEIKGYTRKLFDQIEAALKEKNT